MIDVTLIEGYEPDECEDENRSLTLKEMEELGIPTEPTMVVSFNQEKHWFYNIRFRYFLLCINTFESVNLSVHNDASKTQSVKIIIKGRVQGVSYRYFTLWQAQSFNIFGWVRNEPDGDVKVYAEGQKENLDQFINYLKKGPSFSRVDDVILNWEAEDKSYNEFNIL